MQDYGRTKQIPVIFISNTQIGLNPDQEPVGHERVSTVYAYSINNKYTNWIKSGVPLIFDTVVSRSVETFH